MLVDFGLNYAIATYHQDSTTSVFRAPSGANLAYDYTIPPGQFPQFNFAKPAYVFNPANYNIYDYKAVPDDQKEKALTGRANLRINTVRTIAVSGSLRASTPGSSTGVMIATSTTITRIGRHDPGALRRAAKLYAL